MRWPTVLIAAAVACGPAGAEVRPLDVPPNSGWQHARSGLILMARVGGLTRQSIGDFGTDEADLTAAYNDGGDTIATVYLFHPGIASVPIWFDRSQAALLAQARYGAPVGTSVIQPFTLRSGGAKDALRITYAMHGGELASTALAAVPLGDWLVVVRISSGKDDAATLDQKMLAFLRDIRWPAGSSAVAAVPIAACATPLAFRRPSCGNPT